MAIVTQTQRSPAVVSSVNTDTGIRDFAEKLVPAGRFLYSLIFILSGFGHFTGTMIGYAASQGVPLPGFLVPLSGAIAIAGGLSILLGFHARIGAVLLILFLVPVTLMMHNFWNVPDPMMAQMQYVNFMKNLAMLGGAVLIAYFGSGPLSFDSKDRLGERSAAV